MPLLIQATLGLCIELLLFPNNHEQKGLENCKMYDYQSYYKLNINNIIGYVLKFSI